MITKNMFRLAIYDVLAEYGLTRPPIADDIADAVMKIYKNAAAQQKDALDGARSCPNCGDTETVTKCKYCGARIIAPQVI